MAGEGGSSSSFGGAEGGMVNDDDHAWLINFLQYHFTGGLVGLKFESIFRKV